MIIEEEEIRRIHVIALVDTLSALLCIHEHIVEVLNLRINGRRKIQLVNGFIQEIDLAG